MPTQIEDMTGKCLWSGVDINEYKRDQKLFIHPTNYRVVSVSMHDKKQFVRVSTLGA